MMIVTFCQLVCPLNDYNDGRLCSCQGQLGLLLPMIFFWNQSSCICCDGLSVTLTCLVLIFGILLLPEVYCLVCRQRQHVHVMTVVAYIFSFLLSLSSLDGIGVAHGGKMAASKYGFSFGGKHALSFATCSVAALSLLALDYLAVDYSEDANPSPFPSCPPAPDFALPPSVLDVDLEPLSINRPCSPFESDGLFDGDELGELSDLLGNAPWEGLLLESDETIGLPDDSFFNPDKEERFQNGFGVDMVRHGRYFCPVAPTTR
jgi:hypothetical protein